MLFQVLSLFLHQDYSPLLSGLEVLFGFLSLETCLPLKPPPRYHIPCVNPSEMCLTASVPRALSPLFIILHTGPCGRRVSFFSVSLGCERAPGAEELDLICVSFVNLNLSCKPYLIIFSYILNIHSLFHRTFAKGWSDFQYIQVVNSPSSFTSHDLPNVCVALLHKYNIQNSTTDNLIYPQ